MGHSDMDSELLALSIQEIIDAGVPIKFGREDARDRGHMLETVSQLLPDNQDWIWMIASLKRKRTNPIPCVEGRDPKRTKIGYLSIDTWTPDKDIPPALSHSEFLKAQSAEVVEKCIVNFIDRTGNATLEHAVCVVCAQESAKTETQMMLIGAIPNGHLLVPSETHPAS
jgi:hypothetical protein